MTIKPRFYRTEPGFYGSGYPRLLTFSDVQRLSLQFATLDRDRRQCALHRGNIETDLSDCAVQGGLVLVYFALREPPRTPLPPILDHQNLVARLVHHNRAVDLREKKKGSVSLVEYE